MSYSSNYKEIISEDIDKRLQVSINTNSEGKFTSVDVEIDNRTHTFHSQGSKNISINARIPIEVDIHVDTVPFDRSIVSCNTNVNLLTGAVVATEVAQIASIDENSKKVAETVISGFFGYIRSEISQQISELTQGIDAQVMHLKELSKAVVDKKKQMEGDFNRIGSRYSKIFEDLNNELSNRVYELDKPTFVFKKELDNQKSRSSQNDLVNIVGVFGKESSELHVKISTSVAKKRAFDTLTQAKIFLWQQKALNKTVQKSMMSENTETSQYLPVCFVETKEDKSQISKIIFAPDYISAFKDNRKKNELIELFSDKSTTWSKIPKEHTDNLKIYFNTELNRTYVQADPHSVRVKEMIQKIANTSEIKIISL